MLARELQALGSWTIYEHLLVSDLIMTCLVALQFLLAFERFAFLERCLNSARSDPVSF